MSAKVASEEENAKQQEQKQKESPCKIAQQPWGTHNGQPLYLYTLTTKASNSNPKPIQIQITNLGGTVVSILTPDKNGHHSDIVLGFDNPQDYTNKSKNQYFGCIAGRYANRIAHGRFSLEGVNYELEKNDGGIHHLHGGNQGFDQQVWDSSIVSGTLSSDTTADYGEHENLVLEYVSPDGDQNYPGTLHCRVTYTLTSNQLHIYYKCHTTDGKTTICNLTNHAYFNLKGAGQGTILDHQVQILADQYCPIDEKGIPFEGGDDEVDVRCPADVNDTPFDFRLLSTIEDRIHQNHVQLNNGKGFDHNYCLQKSIKHNNNNNNNQKNGKTTKVLQTHVATIYEPTTRRTLKVSTTEPGLQFYTGNFINDIVGKNGKVYIKRGGLCLEAQTFPNAPNRKDFPSPVLRESEVYEHMTVNEFGVWDGKE